MEPSKLPIFEERHRVLVDVITRLCRDRMQPLTSAELGQPDDACVEYIALLAQEGMIDLAIGSALEGAPPKPDLRALCLLRSRLGRTSGLADAALGAQLLGTYPLALAGDDDQRAIYLTQMAAGQMLVTLALLDGETPVSVTSNPQGYRLIGEKVMVALAPVVDHLLVLARHKPEPAPRYSLFLVPSTAVTVEREDFVSPLPVGRVRLACDLEEEARVGGEGQGLTIIQATLDVLRLPTAAACGGLARQSITSGARALLQHGIGGRPLIGEQGSQWTLADLLSRVESADALVWQAAWARDTTSARCLRETSMARMMAQEAAERACLRIADLVGLRGQGRKQPWPRLLAEVRALRLETELLENPRTVIARALLKELGDLP